MVLMTESKEVKVCKTCNEEKPLSEFSGCGVTADRLQPNCKPCHEERKRAGKAAASEKRAAAAADARQEVKNIEPENPPQPEARIDVPASGIITKEVVTTEVLRWKVGERSVQIEELSREDLLAAARSLFEENATLRAEFEKEISEIAEAYEEKIQSLHYVLAAQVELEIREAVRDKMGVILEVVMGEVERRTAGAERMENESKEGADNER